MLNDAKGFRRIIIACGQTDLRCGIDGFASIVQAQFQMNLAVKGVLFFSAAPGPTESRDSFSRAMAICFCTRV